MLALTPKVRTVDDAKRDRARIGKMRMLCRFLLFCLNHGHAIFMGAHLAAVWVKRLAPMVAKIVVMFAR